MPSKSIARILLLPVALLALVLGACAPAATPGGSQPAAKQELTIVQGADTDGLEPQTNSGRPSQNIIWHINEPLVKISYSESGESKLVPVLAASWKLVNDTTWQFKLRENVKFTNGEPFDAAAVKYSLERMAAADFKSNLKKYAQPASRVDVVDPTTVNVITKTPYPVLLTDFAQVLMVPPKYTAQAGVDGMTLNPVGTGPFKLVGKFTIGQPIVLEANADYWGGRPKLDKVVFKSAPEASTRSAAIQTGQADVIMPLEVSDVPVLQKVKGIRVDIAAGSRLTVIQLDQALTNQYTKNVKVREALNYAVDKEAIIKSIYQGTATLLQGQMLSPAYTGFNPAIKAVPYDPARAKRLLAEAGYPNGFEMDLYATRGAYPGDYDSMQAVANMLGQVGVKANIKVQEYAAWLAGYSSHKLSPATIIASATPTDLASMYSRFRAGGASSMANVPELEKVLTEANSTLDPAKRLELLHKAAQIEHDQYLAIWLWSLPNISAISDRVQGFRTQANESFELHAVSMK